MGKSATITISVEDPKKPTGLKITAPSKTVYMGEKLQLTATLSPKTAESSVTWESSDKKIAKVSKKGVVTPVKAGTATITATASKKSPNGKVVKAKIKITVKKSTAPSSISVGTAEKALHVGDQWQLDYIIKPAGAKASLTFSSSDETVATVNEKGIITANATGSATITVVTQNNKKASCKVTVLAEASGLQLDKESLSLNVGDTYQLTCFVTHGLSGSVTFCSSNAAVATVDANALITAVGVGEATITASMDNGAIATCKVIVKKPETVIDGDLSIFLGKNISEIRVSLNDPFDKVIMREFLYGESELPFTAYEGNNGVKICVWEKDMNIDSVKLDANTPADYNIFGVNANNSFEEVRQTLGCKGVSKVVTERGSVYDPIIEDYYFDDQRKMIIVDYKQKTMYLVEGFWEQVKCIEYY